MPGRRSGQWRAGWLLLFLVQASCAISEDPQEITSGALRSQLAGEAGEDGCLRQNQGGAGVLLPQGNSPDQERQSRVQGASSVKTGYLPQPLPRRNLIDASTAQPPTGDSSDTELNEAAPAATLTSGSSPWHAVQRIADDADLLREEQLQKHLKPWLMTEPSGSSRPSSGSPGGTAELPGSLELGHRWESLGRPVNQTSALEWEHHDLLRWDNQTLARFGTPVLAFSRLAFHASLASQESINIRELRASSRCPPSSCPRFEPCEISDRKLELSTCEAPSHHRTALSSMSTSLKLRNVYISGTGVVFNRSNTFNFDDCSLGKERRYQVAHNHSAGGPVLHVARAISLIHQWGRNFYHNLVEVLPAFFSLAALLAEDPGLPVLMRGNQYEQYLKYGRDVVGIEERKLNVIFPAKTHVLLLVDELIQPHFGRCMSPDSQTLVQLRQHFFLRPDGLPFLHPSLMPRFPRPLPEQDMQRIPRAWKVVLVLRPKKLGRALLREEEVKRQLARHFGAERVATVGSMSVQEAHALLRQARLLVAVHGAALTNMVFMASKTFVLEMRPHKYNLPLYETMAREIGLNYFSSLARGTKGSYARPNMSSLHEQLVAIKARMEDQEQHNADLFFPP